MIKNQYILELRTKEKVIKQGKNDADDVKKVQEWLNLWKRYNKDWDISVAIDGGFGPHTLEVVKEFQRFRKLTVDGIIGNITWRQLSKPMRIAFTRITDDLTIKELIVAYAKKHLEAQPREFKQNEGTWVRAYMDGHEGRNYPWCMGFVQTIIDQATFTIDENLKDYIPKTVGCDAVGNFGLRNHRLVRNKDLRKNVLNVEPGDVFLNVKTALDWTHTGIITAIKGDWFETIEGNTNDEGSREGYEVCKRRRNFKTKNIDVYRIEKL